MRGTANLPINDISIVSATMGRRDIFFMSVLDVRERPRKREEKRIEQNWAGEENGCCGYCFDYLKGSHVSILNLYFL